VRAQIAVLLMIAVWYRTLLTEEEEGSADYGSALRTQPPPVPELEPHQEAYLNAIDQRVRDCSALAQRRRRRFHITAVIGLVAALLVPVLIAANAPGWAAAALGAVAALSQGLQQLVQDQRFSVGAHTAAVELSRARRHAAYELGKCTSRSTQRRVFDAFVARIEEITDINDSRLFEIMHMEADPTQVPRKGVDAGADGQPKN